MFKVGDRVKVVKAVYKECGWENTWVKPMHSYIGKIFMVERVDSKKGVFLGGEWSFPPSSLELVENKIRIVTSYITSTGSFDTLEDAQRASLKADLYVLFRETTNIHDWIKVILDQKEELLEILNDPREASQ